MTKIRCKYKMNYLDGVHFQCTCTIGGIIFKVIERCAYFQLMDNKLD